MKEIIDSSLPIDKYFEKTDDCAQFSNNGNTPDTSAKIIHNSHHVVLVSIIYVDPCKECRRNPVVKQTWIGL